MLLICTFGPFCKKVEILQKLLINPRFISSVVKIWKQTYNNLHLKCFLGFMQLLINWFSCNFYVSCSSSFELQVMKKKKRKKKKKTVTATYIFAQRLWFAVFRTGVFTYQNEAKQALPITVKWLSLQGLVVQSIVNLTSSLRGQLVKCFTAS